jgi:hypothetical protein
MTFRTRAAFLRVLTTADIAVLTASLQGDSLDLVIVTYGLWSDFGREAVSIAVRKPEFVFTCEIELHLFLLDCVHSCCIIFHL